MRRLSQWAMWLFGLMLAACTEVTSFMQVGDEPVYLEPDDWEGLWLHTPWPTSKQEQQSLDPATGVGITSVRVVDAQGGILELCNQYGTNDVSRVVIRQHVTGNKIAFFVNRFTGRRWGYEWGKVDGIRSPLIIWVPKIEKFGELVKTGAISGQIVGRGGESELLLAPLSSEHLDLLTRDEGARLFDYRFERYGEGLDTVWMRISRVPANCGNACPTMADDQDAETP
jgi:hypothetical protein